VIVVHNGIDAAAIESAAPTELDIPPGAIIVGFAARLDHRKGLLDLARAWPAVAGANPAAHLVIAGRGPAEAEARGILAAAPRVHWLGYRSDMASVLKRFDIAAVPSHWEGFGLSAAEALAAGVPVVAANASSLPEIVRHRREGLLVPPRDPDALARALIELVSDAELRRALGEAGRVRVVSGFSSERMVAQYEEALTGLAS
jgi:glycosyltransferase involved in cell wall biosynthesis